MMSDADSDISEESISTIHSTARVQTDHLRHLRECLVVGLCNLYVVDYYHTRFYLHDGQHEDELCIHLTNHVV